MTSRSGKLPTLRFAWLRRWRTPTPWFVRWFGEIEWRVRKAIIRVR